MGASRSTRRTRRRGPTAFELAERRRVAVEARRRQVALWLVALAPLAWIPGGFTRFVFAKLLFVALACVVAGTCSRAGRLPRAVLLSLGAGSAFFILAALAGSTPVASLLGRWPRYEGVPTLALYAGSAWLGARLIGPGRTRWAELERVLTGLSLSLFAFSALDAIGVSPLGAANVSRDGSVLGNATDQGLVAMLCVLALAPSAWEKRAAPLVAALAAGLGTLGLSGSRTSMLLTAIGLGALALAGQKDARRPAALALVALATVAVAVPASRDRLLNGHTIEGRLIQWRLAGHLVRDHVLLGVGPSRYVDVFGRYENSDWVSFVGVRTAPDSPHNWILQVLAAGGVPLLLCAAALAFFVVRRGVAVSRTEPARVGLLVATLAYGAALLANFTVAGSTCLAAFLAGVLIAQPPGVVERTWRRASAVTLSAAASLAMLMACFSEIQVRHGIDAAAGGQVVQAGRDFDAARRWRPFDGDVAMLGAQATAAAVDAGQPSQAEVAADLARLSLERTPETYQANVALAVALLAENKLDEARGVLDQAIALFPQRPAAYIQRGIARFGLRDVTGARADLEFARSLNPGDDRAQSVLDAIEARLS